jgi:uncharacterized Tic20 family protein
MRRLTFLLVFTVFIGPALVWEQDSTAKAVPPNTRTAFDVNDLSEAVSFLAFCPHSRRLPEELTVAASAP